MGQCDDIKVYVKAPMGCGKSFLAAVIAEALEKLGMTVEVDQTVPAAHYKRKMHTVLEASWERKRPAEIPAKLIKITTICETDEWLERWANEGHEGGD